MAFRTKRDFIKDWYKLFKELIIEFEGQLTHFSTLIRDIERELEIGFGQDNHHRITAKSKWESKVASWLDLFVHSMEI